MVRDQFLLDIHDELIVDNFAGGGGWSTAIEQALGRNVSVAVNHNREALLMHEMNHAQTLHLCEDVFHVDPVAVTKGRPVGLGVFSPDCTHFSKARGCKPVSKRIRGLAWVVLRWATLTYMRVFMMENVEEWRTWGPLIKAKIKGKWVEVPDPDRAGQHVEAFMLCLTTGIPEDHPSIGEIREFLGEDFPYGKLHRGLGYQVEWRESRASSFGAPTIRKRFLMIGRRDGRPIVWPEPTHGDPAGKDFREKRLKPWRTAAECIDFTLPCPSIFLNKQEAKEAGCKRPLAPASLARIAKGMDKEVLRKAKPFLVCLTHQGAARVESLENPFATTTAAHRGERAFVTPFVSHAQHKGVNRDAEKPLHTVSASEKDQNQVVAASLAQFAHGEVGKDGKKRWGKGHQGLEELLPAITGSNDTGIVAAAVARTDMPKSNSGCVYPPDDPLRTPTAAGGFGEIEAKLAAPIAMGAGGPVYSGKPKGCDQPTGTLLPENHRADVEVKLAENPTTVGVGGRAGQSGPRDISDPTATGTSKADTALMVPLVARQFKTGVCHSADEPANAVMANGGGGKNQLVSPLLAREFGESVGSGVDQPTGTVMPGGGGKTKLVSPFLAQNNTGVIGRGCDAPSGTILGTGSHQSLVTAALVKYYGNETELHDIDSPAHTVTVKDRMGLARAEIAIPLLTPELEEKARRVAKFLRDHGVEFEGEFATVAVPVIDAETRLVVGEIRLVIYDIGMRMLQPRELYLAQGFPPTYIIDPIDPFTGKRLTKSAQVRMCGNSVSPPWGAAHVRANVPELAVWSDEERRERKEAMLA